jgi:methionine aminotransferase
VRAALVGTPFKVPPAEGTYFQLIDFSDISKTDDVSFAERLLTEAGVATIPLAPFYKEPPRLTVLRLCIAQRDRTLDDAVVRLQAFAKGLVEEDTQ